MSKYAAPLDVLHAWINAVNAGDLDAVTSMYAENASLLPTFSPRVAGTPEKVINYFVQLASRDQLSVTLHDKTVQSQAVKGGWHVLYGIYHFAFEVEEDLTSFASRFTFVVDIESDSPILHHHSSQVPRTLD